MLDVLKDTILDTIKLIPFLFVAFLIIEFIEHKLNNKQENSFMKIPFFVMKLFFCLKFTIL